MLNAVYHAEHCTWWRFGGESANATFSILQVSSKTIQGVTHIPRYSQVTSVAQYAAMAKGSSTTTLVMSPPSVSIFTPKRQVDFSQPRYSIRLSVLTACANKGCLRSFYLQKPETSSASTAEQKLLVLGFGGFPRIFSNPQNTARTIYLEIIVCIV